MSVLIFTLKDCDMFDVCESLISSLRSSDVKNESGVDLRSPFPDRFGILRDFVGLACTKSRRLFL